MKVKFIYKIIPIFVFYGDFMVRLAGRSFGAFVVIKKEYSEDSSLLAHELVHCKQFYRTIGLHMLLYNISKKYRLKAEVEAYKVTIKEKGYTDEIQYKWIIESLYNDYSLDVSKEDIRKLLS